MIASHGAGKLCVAFILLPARRCWLAQQPRHTKHTHTQKLWMNLWHFGCIWRTMRPTCMYRYVAGCFDYAYTIEKSPAGIVMDFWIKAGEQHAYALRMAAGTISDSMHIFSFFFSILMAVKTFSELLYLPNGEVVSGHFVFNYNIVAWSLLRQWYYSRYRL